MREITDIVIHCTATPQTTSIASIQRYWSTPKPNGLGWKNPGYHLVVRPDGSFARLAKDEKVCNGVAGHNSKSIHIAYIGGVDSKNRAVDNRTPEQIKTLVTLVRTMLSRYPNAKVRGHRDFPNVRKDCPSFDVAEWLKKDNVI